MGLTPGQKSAILCGAIGLAVLVTVATLFEVVGRLLGRRRTRRAPEVGGVMDHECVDHLMPKESAVIETHGLHCAPFESFTDLWWVCCVCGERYSDAEARLMAEQTSKAGVRA